VQLRSNRIARAAARRLPVSGAYERRLAELTAQVTELTEQVEVALGQTALKAEELGAMAAELSRTRQKLAELEGARPWVPAGHFYSPFPDPRDMADRRADVFASDPLDVPGVNLRLFEQRLLLDQLDPLTRDVAHPVTTQDAAAQGRRYWTDNDLYGLGDGLWLSAMLRYLRPKRLIELGSGFSSACTLDVRDRWLDGRLDVTFVDPYPGVLESLLRPGDDARVVAQRTELLDLSLFSTLEPGDVLFIDSTHVAKPGSDVNRIFFSILPTLAPGTVIHLHDVFPSFEYPYAWIVQGRAWTEQYVLHGFLQFNNVFEVYFWPGLLFAVDKAAMAERFPAVAKTPGGSLWLRKVS
jgi:hypothetical protein